MRISRSMEFESEMEKEGETGFKVQFVISVLNIMCSQEYEPFVQNSCSIFLVDFTFLC